MRDEVSKARLEGGIRVRFKRSAHAPMPVVSVITVTLNAARELRETIESVQSQRWNGIEHIVIDGASTDGTVELLLAREHEIALWRSECDLGIYDAMNRGLAEAIGEYVLFLNSGDVLRGRVLFPGQDFGRLLPVRSLDFWGRPRRLRLRDVRLGMPYCHQGILFRNDALVPFDTSLRISADYEFLLANFAKACLGPPRDSDAGYVEFDTTGISNTRFLERDVEAAHVILRRFGRLHWLRFWVRQGVKLVVRWLVAWWRGPVPARR